jgi:hypothetical protein
MLECPFDILGPLVESNSGNTYILAVIDQYNKWIELHPLPNMKAETIVHWNKVGMESSWSYLFLIAYKIHGLIYHHNFPPDPCVFAEDNQTLQKSPQWLLLQLFQPSC